MDAPLQLRTLVTIYALSGSPHPDTPPIAAGMAAAIEAENARTPPAGPRRRLPPRRRRFRFSPGLSANGTNYFRFPT
ncbi:hypothetical protein ABIC66_000674 [Caulobacter sp. 1776]